MMLVGAKGDTFVETIFCTVILFTTVGIFAYTLSSISNIFEAITESGKKYKRDVEILNFYLNRKNVNKKLKSKLLNYLKHFHGGHLDM